jgi:hypothetical protein
MTAPKMREIKLNGIVIGSIPQTGDPDVDAAASMQLLKDLGLYKPTPRAQTMFAHAQAFGKMASQAHDMINRDRARHVRMYVPFAVNSAFAIEVYLKTLHELSGTQARGHDLVLVYDALIDAMKTALSDRLPTHAKEWKQDPATPFRSFLAPLATNFIDWRYAYEDSGPINFPPQVAITVMQTLHHACRDIGDQQGWLARN